MGRKKKGNVLFARRVPPEKVPHLLALLKAARIPDESAAEIVDSLDKARGGVLPIEKDLSGGDSMVNIKAQFKALLDDIERLTKELEEERGKVKRALDMDLDEKGKMGWRLYFKLKEEGKSGDYDQTRT